MTRTFTCAAMAAIMVLETACDPKAKAGGSGIAGASASQLSSEYESCSSSLECVPGLRCADGTCRLAKASVVGDYHAAVGMKALKAGELEAAIAAYGEAVNQYKASNEIEVPVVLYCEQGHALTQLRRNPEYAELAARVLHRCVMGTPNGSELRKQALADLALLGDVGLDPLLLARPEAGDRYMTKAPKRPPAESLKVTVGGDIRTRARSYQSFVEQLETSEMRDALLPCWEQYWKATTKTELTLTFPFKHRFHEGVYEEEDRYKLSVGESPATSDPALAAAHQCAAGVLETFAKEFRGGSGSWSGDATITLGD
jgi:hypothetical protein